ncbi:DUF177 domain-containing protein [candidate division KSB3 bacterium]|uniref:DUF177 domain-containing protein n=1 Tax=candidate division KSB3 bacterium TaxID=2044937 RepID=A0A9D5JYX3_9BACT|nr:DUF177 domain-containing protein [candidate division KSB3 bacterium]MBD3326779.1 DUF177 domain-containing protein [candidate division KSB3 bacterium]
MTPVAFETHVRKVGEEITITGHIAARIEVGCSRCLVNYEENIDEEVEVVFLPRSSLPKEVDDLELDETDLNVSYYEGETLSLVDLIREQVILTLPMKPLCRPDCAGLCPSCGKDLNAGPCTCPQETLDPRLAVLQQLLITQNDADT